jgi:hypothetical protein
MRPTVRQILAHRKRGYTFNQIGQQFFDPPCSGDWVRNILIRAGVHTPRRFTGCHKRTMMRKMPAIDPEKARRLTLEKQSYWLAKSQFFGRSA